MFTLIVRWLCRTSLVYGLLIATVNAQQPGTPFQNVEPERLAQIFRQATSDNMIVVDLKAAARGNTIVFRGSLVTNDQKRSWYTMINVDRQKLQKAQREFQTKGYVQVVLTSAALGGRTYYTGAWAAAPVNGTLTLPEDPHPVTGDPLPAAESIDTAMLAFLREHNCPGAAVCIAKDGRLLYSKGFGWADMGKKKPVRPDTKFRIASLSKPITAVAVMKLIEDGKLRLDDRIVPLLRKLRRLKNSKITDERWNTITVRQLLQHTGGWDKDVSSDPMFRLPEIAAAENIRRSPTPIDVIRYQMKQPLDFEPGERYAYANFGYCLLGRIIEAITEESYRNALDDLVLKPAAMTDTMLGRTLRNQQQKNEATYYTQQLSKHTLYTTTVFRVTRNARPAIPGFVDAPYGRWGLEVMDSHGGLLSSAPDLVRFVSALDQDSDRLLSEESLKQMTGLEEHEGASWYGCGWTVRRTQSADKALSSCNIWHTGGLDGTAALLVRRWDGYAWAVLFNCDKSPNGTRLATLIDRSMHRFVNNIDWE